MTVENVTVLAGGVGGSKLVDGLAKGMPPEHLAVIGNIGDDIEQHGLWVSPDIDILTYTLAGVVDVSKGWGFKDESFRALEALDRLGESTWMNLGDQDLATHIFRTHLRRQGVRPTEIALRVAKRLGVKARVLVPTDDPLQTMVRTDKGVINFQEFFLRERCEPEIMDVFFDGSETAMATPEVLESISAADFVIVAPSNPVASIGPILAVKEIDRALCETRIPRIGVCPIVGGRSLKGPSDRMLRAANFSADPVGVADYYGDRIDAIVIDEEDADAVKLLRSRGLGVLVTSTVMKTPEDRVRLAKEVVAFAGTRMMKS